MLTHFKIETCSSVNVADICEQLFTDRYLVVLHKGKHENPHWHFQGNTNQSGKQIDKCLAGACENHSKYIKNIHARPFKRMQKSKACPDGPTEKGYQYMLKHGAESAVKALGFETEEIEALVNLSNEHNHKLKFALKEFLLEANERHPYDGTPTEIHLKWRLRAASYYVNNEKMPPPNFQKLVIWIMLNHFKKDMEMCAYLVSKI